MGSQQTDFPCCLELHFLLQAISTPAASTPCPCCVSPEPLLPTPPSLMQTTLTFLASAIGSLPAEASHAIELTHVDHPEPALQPETSPFASSLQVMQSPFATSKGFKPKMPLPTHPIRISSSPLLLTRAPSGPGATDGSPPLAQPQFPANSPGHTLQQESWDSLHSPKLVKVTSALASRLHFGRANEVLCLTRDCVIELLAAEPKAVDSCCL